MELHILQGSKEPAECQSNAGAGQGSTEAIIQSLPTINHLFEI